MSNLDLVRYHLNEAFAGAVAEAEGNVVHALHVNARAKLRLISMSDEDVRELSKLMTCLPERTVDQVFANNKQAIEIHRITAKQWVKYL